MRDINRAERLLSLFTSPDSAAGIVGDLNEERGQHGKTWFWRQVLGTVFSLCRGAVFESPAAVLLPLALGAAMWMVFPTCVSVIYVIEHRVGSGTMLRVFGWCDWPWRLITGAAMVAAAPKRGMAACVLLSGLRVLVSLGFALYLVTNGFMPLHTQSSWWLGWTVGTATTPLLLLLGGALVRWRLNARTLRSAQ